MIAADEVLSDALREAGVEVAPDVLLWLRHPSAVRGLLGDLSPSYIDSNGRERCCGCDERTHETATGTAHLASCVLVDAWWRLGMDWWLHRAIEGAHSAALEEAQERLTKAAP